jgi:hypothetical protein
MIDLVSGADVTDLRPVPNLMAMRSKNFAPLR